ncbi:MAG: hypothetical protein IJS50_03330 [Desulfovibrio sp.]|nr:hypothetical protein [Desulfovibrio sp.]
MRTLGVICLILILLPGCASKYGPSRTNVHYYSTCYRPIQQLRDNEYNVEKGTAGGAVLGALGGALLGFLSTGKVEGALVGGVSGAAAGAVIGNIYAKKKQIADDNRRLASYLEDIDGDIRQLDIVSASARTTLDCYDHEFANLLQLIKSKRVSRAEAEQRFGEISTGREEAIALLGKAVTKAQDLDRQYEEAFRQEEATSTKTARRRVQKVSYNQARRHKQGLTRKAADVAKQKESANARAAKDKQDFQSFLDEIDA